MLVRTNNVEIRNMKIRGSDPWPDGSVMEHVDCI